MAFAAEYSRKQILESRMEFREGWMSLVYSQHAMRRLRERLRGNVEVYPQSINISKLNINRGYSFNGRYLHKVVIRLEFKRDEWIFLVILPKHRLVKSLWFQFKENNPMKQETKEQWDLFQEVWKEHPTKECQSCGKRIYGPNKPLYHDHLLEKNRYPEFRLDRRNLFLVCGDCHQKKSMGFPTAIHKAAIEKAKELLLNNKNQTEE